VDRKLIYECFPNAEHPSLDFLRSEGFEIDSFDDFDLLLEQVMRRRPRAVVCGLRPRSPQDVGMLQLLRRVAPDLPLVLLATESSLRAQRQVQSLRPVYYAVCPVEVTELRDAVLAATSRSARHPEH